MLNPGEEIARGLFGLMAPEQVIHHHGHERAREQIRGEHREDHRQGQRREEIFRRAGQEHDRDEHDTDGQRGDERRPRDLLGAVENRVLERFALCEIAMDVFDLDGGVIDQNTDRERQAAERHHVERVAQQAQHRQIDERIDSGIETATMNVLRQLPRKRRIIVAVSNPAMMLSFTTPAIAAGTKSD